MKGRIIPALHIDIKCTYLLTDVVAMDVLSDGNASIPLTILSTALKVTFPTVASSVVKV